MDSYSQSRDDAANWTQQSEGSGYGSYPPPAPYWHHAPYPQLYPAYPYATPSISPQHAEIYYNSHQQTQDRCAERIASTSATPTMTQTPQTLAAPTPTSEPPPPPAPAKRKRRHKENAAPPAKRAATGTTSSSSDSPLVPGVGPCTLPLTRPGVNEPTSTASQRANIEFRSLLSTGNAPDDPGLASDVWFHVLPAQTKDAPTSFTVGVGYSTNAEALVQDSPPSRHRRTSPSVRCRLCL